MDQTIHIVYTWECDRFSGRRLDNKKTFWSYQEAMDYVKEFNSYNTEETVPEWYMIATYEGCAPVPEGNPPQ